MMRPRLLLTAAGVVLLAALAVFAASGDLHRHIPRLFLLYGVAFAAYLAALRVAFSQDRADRSFYVIMLVVAVAARGMLLPCRPDLSTDIYRYAWEGRVVLHGGNPFATAPSDTSLAPLRDDDYPLINHKDLGTIYPPLAQYAFALAAWIRPGVITLKALLALFDLGTLVVLLFLLRARGRPPTHAIAYAWSPLVIIETAHSGHMDTIGVFFLLLGITLLARRAAAGFASLGASFLAKYTTVGLLPFFVVRRRWLGLAIVGLVVVAGYLPFMDAGPKLIGSLRVYSSTWWFNGPAFMGLAGWLGDAEVSRRLLAAGGVAFALVAALRHRDIVRYTYLILGCWLLITPTVYPWYLIWIVPFIALYRSRAWLAFTGLVYISYYVWTVYDSTGAWALPTRVLALEYLPFYLVLARDAFRARAGDA